MSSFETPEILVVFRQSELSPFRQAELESLLQLNGCDDYKMEWTDINSAVTPFMILRNVCIDVMAKVMKRSSMIRDVVYLFGRGRDVRTAAESGCKEYPSLHARIPLLTSWSMRVETYGGKITPEEKNAVRSIVTNAVGICRDTRVDLKNPEAEFCVYSICESNPSHARYEAWLEPQSFIGFGIKDLYDEGFAIIGQLSLSNRPYLSPTAMPPWRCQIMANLAHVKPGNVVWDPCCGSGSIVISNAALGAITFASDIDYKVLHGGKCNAKRGGAKDLKWDSNFKHYGFEPPVGLIRGDMSTPFMRSSWDWVDAIVTDPPYGIRAGTKTTNTKKGNAAAVDTKGLIPQFQANEHMDMNEIYAKMIEMAAYRLKLGGRLVFWLPTREVEQSKLPSHPAMRIVMAPWETLNRCWKRWLVVMEKVLHPKEDMVATVNVDTPTLDDWNITSTGEFSEGQPQSKKDKKRRAKKLAREAKKLERADKQ